METNAYTSMTCTARLRAVASSQESGLILGPRPARADAHVDAERLPRRPRSARLCRDQGDHCVRRRDHQHQGQCTAPDQRCRRVRRSRRDPFLESTGIATTHTGSSKAANPETRDPRPFCFSEQSGPTRKSSQVTTRRKCPADHQPTDHRSETDQGGDPDAARCRSTARRTTCPSLAEPLDDDQLPCRVNDPELFFADSPGRRRVRQDPLPRLPRPPGLPRRCSRAPGAVGRLGRRVVRPGSRRAAQASAWPSPQDRGRGVNGPIEKHRPARNPLQTQHPPT